MKKYTKLTGKNYLRVIQENEDALADYLGRITKIATSRYVWKNLPNSMDGEFLEIILFMYGQAAFVYDENKGGHINTKCTTGGQLNIYGLPTKLCCYSYGYNTIKRVYNGEITFDSTSNDLEKLGLSNTYEDTCIHVLDNRLAIPTMHSIERFARRLAEADITADINIKAQKTPIILTGSQNQVLTLKNLYNQYAGNSPIIIGDNDTIDLKTIQAVKTDAPFVANDIINYKKEIWNELLTFLGINNIVTDKRERQIKDEVNSNNELINLNLKNGLIMREKACELFNKKFGLTGENRVSVRVNSDLNNIIKEVLSDVKELKEELDTSNSSEYMLEYNKESEV